MRPSPFGAAAMLCGSLLAHADTITISEIFTSPTTISTSADTVYSNPFQKFDPALGTLTSYTLSVAGTGSNTDGNQPHLVFKAPGTYTAVVNIYGSSSGTFTFSGSGSTHTARDLEAITGSGDAQFAVQDFSLLVRGSSRTVLDFTKADLTYTYTPTQVAATPEPSSLALLGTGLLGMVGMMKRRFA